MAGGPYDDKIFTGNGVTGLINIPGVLDLGATIVVYGDKSDLMYGDVAPTPDSNDMLPLVEYPETFNKYDGNDIIDVGDENGIVKVYGQGGNDKIIGGVGASQVDQLWGGSGDDKIWMINPNQRHLDTAADQNYGYGGIGNDSMYGTDGPD